MSHIFEQQLKEIQAYIHQQSLQAKDIMNVPEAAAYMGVSCSYVYKLTSTRQLPFHKPGAKLIYLKKEDLRDYMLRNRQQSVEEISHDLRPSHARSRKKRNGTE